MPASSPRSGPGRLRPTGWIPFQVEDFPFGEARPILARAPTAWINGQVLDDDWALLTLNRRVGAHTGWMARETNVQTTALNFTGYPVEIPFVPPGNLLQYYGFDPNNVAGYTPGRILLEALVYGGHSGGPAWRFLANNHFLQGILSTSDRAGNAEATRLTSTMLTQVDGLITQDENDVPPIARPDLIEYLLAVDAKDLLTNVAAPGQFINVEYNAFNAGHANSGPITIDFYLSTNNVISTFDTYAGSVALGALDGFFFWNPVTTLTVPPGLPGGTYWVGWIMRGTVAEYNVFDNAAVIDDETLLVSTASGSPDIRVEPLTLDFSQAPVPTGDPILVEVDWMQDGTHSHRPSQAVIDAIVATFAAAGYDIQIDVSNAIPHQQTTAIVNNPGSSPAVQALMNQHFNHANDDRYFYSLWVHNYSFDGSPTGSSGIADLPGRVHLVSLGSFPDQTGTTDHQIGTFIHEFGHNLGQKHGGVDHGNFKPNYVSVMNYHYQLEGIGPTLVALGFANDGSGFDDFAYSHGLRINLNENNLNENTGIGLGKTVDWDCDGTIEASVAKDVQAVDWCEVESGRSVITDFDNWSDIRPYIRTRTSSAEPLLWSQPCISWEEHRPIYERVQALRAAGLLGEAQSGATRGQTVVQRSFTIYNDGGTTLQVSSLALSQPAPWIAFAGSPFSLAPGASRQITVSVDLALAPPGESSRQLLIASNDGDENPYPGGVQIVVREGVADVVFQDGFESGNTSAWSAAVP